MSATVTEEGLATLLQACRDFAARQLAQGQRLVPFAARALPSGEIDFVRFVGEDTNLPLDEVHRRTRSELAAQVQGEGLVAAAVVSAVEGSAAHLGDGFTQAVRVELEAAGFSRTILSPYCIEPRAGGGAELVSGKLVTLSAAPELFA